MISAKILRKLLDYNPKTGVFTNRVARGSRAHAGGIAGSLCSKGYLQIHLEGRYYRAHRLAWLWMTGRWPANEIDHRDTVKTNNRWKNLRNATRSQNAANAKLSCTNVSGQKGVTWHAQCQKWQAQINAKGRYIYLGIFETYKAACAAYRRAAEIHFKQFMRLA